MKITNNKNLPAPIYQAVLANPYSKGTADISVTDLINPPKLVALQEKHAEDITQDASDMIWSLMGTTMHTVLERAGIASGKGDTEQRLYMEVDLEDGSPPTALSGQFDYIDEEGVLWDWKFVSVYEYLNGVKNSRTQQLNVYASLAAANGLSVTGLRVGFIFRDWSQRTALSDNTYPQAQAVQFDIDLWPGAQRDEFIRERIKLHKQAKEAPQAIDCKGFTEQGDQNERWEKPESWAVFKNTNKRALRVLPDKDTAEAYLNDQQRVHPKDKYKIEYRQGESTRCKYYCPVLKYCNQGQQYR